MAIFGNAHSNFDFDTPGKSNGFIDINHSDNDHAFSIVRIPVGLINGGDGPTILLTAGNHGDEYEGQIILHRLMQSLQPHQVSGRIIMLPALNTPAVLDRARVSPLDQGNMNRSFPGNEGAGPTQAISGFVNTHLIPMADTILDFHSGGTSAQYANCGFHCRGKNQNLNDKNLELVDAFAAPFTIVFPLGNNLFSGDFDAAAYAQETPFLSCELGGMGRVSEASLMIGWDGCLRVLKMLGLITDETLNSLNANQQHAPTQFIDLGDEYCHITVSKHGIAELHIGLGSFIKAGTEAATVYDLHNFGTKLENLTTPCDGIVTAQRRNPVIMPGDHLYLICPKIKREAFAK